MITVELDPTEPLFAAKLELLESDKISRNYVIYNNFDKDSSMNAFSAIRLAVYDEDPSYLLYAKQQCIQAA